MHFSPVYPEIDTGAYGPMLSKISLTITLLALSVHVLGAERNGVFRSTWMTRKSVTMILPCRKLITSEGC